MAGIIIGMQRSMRTFSGTPGSEPSQPHRRTATAAPSAAPIEKTSRMAVLSAGTGLPKLASRSRNAAAMTAATMTGRRLFHRLHRPARWSGLGREPPAVIPRLVAVPDAGPVRRRRRAAGGTG